MWHGVCRVAVAYKVHLLTLLYLLLVPLVLPLGLRVEVLLQVVEV